MNEERKTYAVLNDEGYQGRGFRNNGKYPTIMEKADQVWIYSWKDEYRPSMAEKNVSRIVAPCQKAAA